MAQAERPDYFRGMPSYLLKQCRRDVPELTAGKHIDQILIEAEHDGSAIAQAEGLRDSFRPDADFAVLFNANDEPIWPVDNPRA